MQLSKKEVLDILEKNGMNKEFAEKIAEQFGKAIGYSALDILQLIVDKTPNQLDDAGFAVVKPKLKKFIDELDITL
jgi:hypothetical protein